MGVWGRAVVVGSLVGCSGLFAGCLFIEIIRLHSGGPPPLMLPVLRLLQNAQAITPMLLPIFPRIILPLLRPACAGGVLGVLLGGWGLVGCWVRMPLPVNLIHPIASLLKGRGPLLRCRLLMFFSVVGWFVDWGGDG